MSRDWPTQFFSVFSRVFGAPEQLGSGQQQSGGGQQQQSGGGQQKSGGNLLPGLRTGRGQFLRNLWLAGCGDFVCIRDQGFVDDLFLLKPMDSV